MPETDQTPTLESETSFQTRNSIKSVWIVPLACSKYVKSRDRMYLLQLFPLSPSFVIKPNLKHSGVSGGFNL